MFGSLAMALAVLGAVELGAWEVSCPRAPLSERLARLTSAEPVQVSARRDEEKFAGRVEVTRQGQLRRREFSAATCEELVEVLSLGAELAATEGRGRPPPELQQRPAAAPAAVPRSPPLAATRTPAPAPAAPALGSGAPRPAAAPRAATSQPPPRPLARSDGAVPSSAPATVEASSAAARRDDSTRPALQEGGGASGVTLTAGASGFDGEVPPVSARVERAPRGAAEDTPAAAPTEKSASVVAAPLAVTDGAREHVEVPAGTEASAPAQVGATARTGPLLGFELGGRAALVLGPAPVPSFGAAAVAALLPLGGALRLELSVLHARSLLAEVGPSRARFSLTTARVGVCSPALAWRRLEARACASVAGGVLWAQGFSSASITTPREVFQPWLDGAASARVSIALPAGLRVELHGGPTFPLTRHGFVFDTPTVEIHTVGPVGLEAGVGLVLAR